MAMQPQQFGSTSNGKMYPSSSLSLQSINKSIMTNTVIVFDFDDTLFPTKQLKEIQARTNSHRINSNKFRSQSIIPKMTESEMIKFINLSYITLNLLLSYINRYSTRNICIVSASSKGWIKEALKTVYDIGYFNQIYHLLFDDKMCIDKISIFNPSTEIIKSFKIKKEYKSMNQHPCCQWKYNVFNYIIDTKSVISEDVINIFVFIGDSLFEYEAAYKLTKKFQHKNKNVFIDRIKLISKPSVDSLIHEQNYLYSICGSYENYSCINKCGFNVDYFKEIQKQITSQLCHHDKILF